jgi:hypothetical protein
MGLPPKGEIVARPMITRACGCVKEFQHYAVDKYRTERLAKFQQSRCPECVAKLAEERKRAAPLSKGEALKLLPSGTQVSLTIRSDGSWAGTLAAGGTVVESAASGGAGPQAVIVALARLWHSSHKAEFKCGRSLLGQQRQQPAD